MIGATARRSLFVAFVTAPVAGCLAPSAVTCGDGRVCPEGSRCDDQRHRCVTSAQELACVGHAEGDVCLLVGAAGACRGSACDAFVCGNGVLEGSEACDGAPPPGKTCLDYGFDQGLVGCSAICTLALESCSSFGWTEWPELPAGTASKLTGIWGTSADDTYLVGGAGILHWDSSRWSTTVPEIDVRAVWGSGPDDVFAVGAGIVHWDGSSWSTMFSSDTMQFSAVSGNGPRDVFAVGQEGARGATAHWDGTRWSFTTSSATSDPGPLVSVWAGGPEAVYAVGSGPIFRWNGSSWSMAFSGDQFEFFAVSGTGPNDVFAVGADYRTGSGVTAHWNGTGWFLVSGSLALNDVWVGGPHAVYAVDVEGSILEWHGAWDFFPVVDAHNVPLATRFFKIGGTASSIFAIGDGPVLHWGGSRWSPLFGHPARAVWAIGPDDAYLIDVSRSAIDHWNGTDWSAAGGLSDMHVAGIWGSGPDDVFVVTAEGFVLRQDGSSWVVVSSGGPTGIVSLWANASDDVVAVSSAPSTLVHWDGARWSTLSALPDATMAVWASDPQDVFLVGIGFSHWDGSRLTSMNDAGVPSVTFKGVWGSGPEDVYAVGEAGAIVHWDGARWRAMTSGTSDMLYAVHGSGAADVFAAGADVLLHLRAGAWEPVYVPGVSATYALWVTPRRVFVAGLGEAHLDRRSVTCVGPERDCRDGWDNDCDGAADGADADCAGKVSEQCANAVDDDGDRKVDCADPDCASYPTCRK